MKITVLGTGSWGFCLASILAEKGFQVTSWTTNEELANSLNSGGEHPLFPGYKIQKNHTFTTDLKKAVNKAMLMIESVTSAGLRPVMKQLKKIHEPEYPIILTSKGIEQKSGLILSDVIVEIFGEDLRPHIGSLSGPSFAQEVIKGLPTSVVGSAYDEDVMMLICNLFTTATFRVYPNSDMRGVAFGGAMKNITAIACGIAEGLNLGQSAKAALMTRGLHEIRKLGVAQGCNSETFSGLSGMGDLCLTCGSTMSRNYRFGHLLAQNMTPEQAKEQIGMVVEGAYTAVSALELSKKMEIELPITEMVHHIIYEGMTPTDAVTALMQRTIKEEHL